MKNPVDPSWPEIFFWLACAFMSLVLRSGWLFLAGVLAFFAFSAVQTTRYNEYKSREAKRKKDQSNK